jgi:CysZ protein
MLYSARSHKKDTPMLVTIFIKALRNLTLPGILRLFLICLVVYIIGGIAMAALFSWLAAQYIAFAGAEGWIAGLLGGAGGTVMAWFLFPLLYPVLVSFFDEKMASVIERADYPQLPPSEPPFWPTLLHDILFSLKALALNIVLLPVYLIPVVGLVVYYGLNGYLLGTQFFRMSAGKRAPREKAEQMRRNARGTILAAGIGISFCSTIPLLNLAAPLIGVAAMLHLFHALNGTDRQQIMPPG